MKRPTSYWLALPLVALLILLGNGCSHRLQCPIVLSPTDSAAGSIEVDLVGLSLADKPRYESYPVREYFPNGPLRKDSVKVTYRIAPGQSQTLAITDEIWQRWQARGVDHIAILADLPDAKVPEAGRRLILPLDTRAFPKAKQLHIEVQGSGLVLLTPMKPLK